MPRFQNPFATMPAYDARRWYWNVRDDGPAGQVFGSASGTYVNKTTDPDYLAFLAGGGFASTIASRAELVDVLDAQAPEGAPWSAKVEA